MSLMTDVFREFEKLKRDLEDLRDALAVKDDDFYYEEINSAKHRCMRIAVELKKIQQLLPRRTVTGTSVPPPSRPPFKPKLVS